MHWLLGLPLVDRRRFPASASRPAACAAAALCAVLTITGDRAAAQTAPPPTVVPAPGTTALTYRLTGDWFDVPYTGALTRLRLPVDVSTGPDGTVFVLEYPTSTGIDAITPSRVHVLAPDGTLRRVVDLSAWLRVGRRLDAAWDGSVVVLGTSPAGSSAADRVVILEPDGRRRGGWEIPGDAVNDVAALPDGRIAVATSGGVTIVDPADGTRDRIVFGSLGIDPPGTVYEHYLHRLDAAADGRITVLDFATRDCPPPPSVPQTPPTPRPTATPRPSLSSDAAAPWGAHRPADRAQSEAPCTKRLAVTLGPSFAVDTITLLYEMPDDLAVRDGPVFIPRPSSAGDVLLVTTLDGLQGPSARYRHAQHLPDDGRRYSRNPTNVAIDVAPDGALLAVWMGNDRFTSGPLRLGVPGGANQVPRGLAYGDVPALTGPVRPRAVSASADGVSVLDGAYALARGSAWPERRVDEQGQYNGIQRWSPDGQLLGQWTHAGGGSIFGSSSAGVAPDDIASVGDRVYVATPDGIWLRQSMIEPAWYSEAPGGSVLIAVDADDDAVAAFDAAGSRVVVWEPDGRLLRTWPVAADGRAVAASDLTVGGGRVYIADTGRNRVLVRSLAGEDLGEWRTHDGPRRLDMTLDGDVVVLGRGGWGLRYTPDGALRAAWRLPGARGAKRAEGTDISAAPDGSVYVAYSRVTIGSAVDRVQDVVEAAGIWRFELAVPTPDGSPASPPLPDPDHCLVDVDKVASPARVPLGAPVSITLVVQGDCPKVALPEQILFVVDTSWSMNDGYRYASVKPGALERARRVLVPLLGALDPAVVDVGLVTFGDGASLQTLLSDDIADLRSRILRAQADGDTRMGAGVDLAHGELNGPRRAAGARRAIVIVSDGVFKDDPRAAIAAARADEIDVHALIVTTPEFTPTVRRALEAMLGPDHLDVDPSPDRAQAVIDAIGAWRTEPNAFDALTVRDVVPANMRYVEGSAVPAAAWEASTRTLTWTLPPRPAGLRVTLTYAVVPQETGTWPTNVEADATWRDVRGGGGRLRFPVPHVDVVDRRRIFLPYAMRAVCASWTRPIDLVLVQDVSSSMSERAADGRRTKLEVAVEAAAAFLDRLNTFRDRVAVVAFDADAHVVAPLSNDFAAARSGLASLRPGRGTRIDRGLASSVAVLGDDLRALALPVVVLLSDGLQNGSADPVRAVLPELRAIGSRVFVIGYGQAVDEALLREIASDPADYRYAPAVEDLRAVYEGVGRTLLCP